MIQAVTFVIPILEVTIRHWKAHKSPSQKGHGLNHLQRVCDG